ncbi:MAG: 6-carboxytetrahydropterin synthase QueD [Bryobacterales bacterium]|nr:6-carboxytetrahydropterin synthase QueD [Bryobacteraceae bacterium]MDW8131700.1 6-carboxytetrahydropterin synthase QueD [Bryobacterales bacterium]
MFEIAVEECFAAAHALRSYRGKCENVHGHNYKVEVALEGEQLDGAGLLVDFVELKRWLREIIERLDHRLLNDVAPFDRLNPTAENMARYFWEEVARELAASPHAGRVRVARVTVRETDSTCAVYRP